MRGLLALLAIGNCLGCARGSVPCAGPNTCAASEECLANRCHERGGAPVRRSAERIVLQPSKLTVITQKGPQAGSPAAVTFGSAALGRTALYMRFPLSTPRTRAIESAFLLLEPLADTPVDARDIHVEAWRVRKSWNSSLRWSSQPGLGLPKAEGIARSTPRQPLRIDVTEIVRYLNEAVARSHDHGLALTAAAGDGHGASFATGTGGGRAPRLEVYLR